MIARTSFFGIAILLFASAAFAQSPAGIKPVPAQAKSVAAHRAAPATITVPSGTKIPLILENAISTRYTHAGDPVYFQTLYPIIVAGHIAIPAGSYMSGEVLSVKRPGRIKGRGQLVLKITQLILPNGYTVSLVGAPSNVGTGGGETTGKEGQINGPTSRGRDAQIIVRNSVQGAIIGAAAARATGAKAGLGIGAAAGLLGVLLTRGPNAVMPRGTTMNVVLDRPIPLLAAKVQFKTPGDAPVPAGPRNRGPVQPAFPL